MTFLLAILYLAASYLRPFELYPQVAELRIMAVLGIASLVAVLTASVSGRGKWLTFVQSYLMACLFLWIGVSAALAGWVGGALVAWSDIGSCWLLYAVVSATATTFYRVRVLTRVMVACSLCLAVQGIAAYHVGYEEDKLVLRQGRSDCNDDGNCLSDGEFAFRRIRSLGSLNDPNDFSQALVLAIPLLLVLRRPERTVNSVVRVGIPAAILLYATYLTFSRGAFLALGVIGFLEFKEHWGAIRATILASMCAGVLLAFKMTAGRAISIHEESAAERVDAWSLGLELLRAHPLAGIGYGHFTDHNRLTAHNSFVLSFAELGLIGHFFWLALSVVTFLQLTALINNLSDEGADERRWVIALRNSLCACLVSGFFLSRTYNQSLYLLIALSAACCSTIHAERDAASSRCPWLQQTVLVEAVSILAIYAFVRLTHAISS